MGDPNRMETGKILSGVVNRREEIRNPKGKETPDSPKTNCGNGLIKADSAKPIRKGMKISYGKFY